MDVAEFIAMSGFVGAKSRRGGLVRVKAYARLLGVVFSAAFVAGCGGNEVARLADTVAPRDLNVFQRREPLSARSAPAEELINPDGRCASEPAPAPTGMPLPSSVLAFTAGPGVAGQNPGAPFPSSDPQGQAGAQVRGIALDMTECEVVRIAGVTDRVEISANERGQRTAVLTYVTGSRPGIYRFVSGRLASIERGPEPPAPAKPAKQKRRG